MLKFHIPKGTKGEKGDLGAKGDQGDIGPIGPQGPHGVPGQDGKSTITAYGMRYSTTSESKTFTAGTETTIPLADKGAFVNVSYATD